MEEEVPSILIGTYIHQQIERHYQAMQDGDD
jgi:hypothetical protein